MNLMLRWQALIEQPLSFVDPRYLRQCFAEDVPDHWVQALGEAPRFQSRLLTLLMRHFQLPPLAQVPRPAEQDLPVLLLRPAAFRSLPRLCGAIWHGAALGREIRREAVEHLRRGLGQEVFTLALAHRQWSGAMDLPRQPDDLLAAIEHDGARCVHAWVQAQPEPLRQWLVLRLDTLPADASVSPLDAGIVRRVAGLAAAADEQERAP
ncbi:type III secretion protein [Pseudomonas sp. X10]